MVRKLFKVLFGDKENFSMCGFIFGYGVSLDNRFDLDLLKHRGPDYSETWVSDTGHYFCGHNRLSILDLTAGGNQPLFSKDQRWVFVYNGEIYNHEQIRRNINLEFPDYQWRGTSDTETILAAFDIYGIEKTLELCSGCLLYTSPSPRDRQKSRMPSSA